MLGRAAAERGINRWMFMNENIVWMAKNPISSKDSKLNECYWKCQCCVFSYNTSDQYSINWL